jgi:hypothetical protein
MGKFKSGDRVIATKMFESNSDIVGVSGTVRKVDHTTRYGVEFDKHVNGHRMSMDDVTFGHAYYVEEDYLIHEIGDAEEDYFKGKINKEELIWIKKLRGEAV